MKRLLFLLIFMGILGGGGFWVTKHQSSLASIKNIAFELLNKGKLQTLEIRHSAENIMENHKKLLLKDNNHTYLSPDLHFHPYLLLEVKYTKPGINRTGEGIILWSMVDGEMVINTSNWSLTHGFSDCIRAKADRDDFKVINALACHHNSLDRESLTHVLNVESNILDLWVDNCRRKSLVVQSGNHYRLHLENPKLEVLPETKLDQWLVTKPAKTAKKLPRKYRAYQIENIAKSAFGNKDFTIKKRKEIFLPVYSIVVQNPDGSQMTTYWNALNGKRLPQSFQID